MSNDKPVSAHLVRTYLPPTQTFVANQIAQLRRYRGVVVCHHRTSSEYSFADGVAAHEEIGAFLRPLDAATDRFARTPIPACLRAMQRFVADQDAAVLHVHFLVNARTYRPLVRDPSRPTVVSAYGYDVSGFPRRLGGLGRRYLAPIFGDADCFLAMTADMRDDLIALGCPEDKIRVHYHGIDSRRFRSPGPSLRHRHALDGRLRRPPRTREGPTPPAGGLSPRHLRRNGSDSRLVLVGEGPMRPLLEASIERLGLQDRVRLVGHVSHGSEGLLDHYRDADIFCLPSETARGHKEGIPGTLVEAMASGLPVVSTRHAGIPSVVSEREGILVDEGDVLGLEEALSRLSGDESLRRQLGAAGAERAAAEFDLAPATAALEEIYDELTGR